MEQVETVERTDLELEALVAETAFGCTVERTQAGGVHAWNRCDNAEHWLHPWHYRAQTWDVPRFASDGAAMLDLIEKLKEHGWIVRMVDSRGLPAVAYVEVATGPSVEVLGYGTHDRLPRAVAEAAYRALTSDRRLSEGEGKQ